MTRNAPGKAEREGLTLIEMMGIFPDERTATAWFEGVLWGGERHCGHCGSTRTRAVPKAKPMPYWCTDCRSYFSVKTGTAIARSNVPLRKWAIAIYLCLTSLKSVSSMKLHRDIGVSQPTAWFMLHRIREAWAAQGNDKFDGPVEADEAYFGGKRKNRPKDRRREPKRTGILGKTIVAGGRDRATDRIDAAAIPDTSRETLHAFVEDRTEPTAKVYTDEHPSYRNMRRAHETVRHSDGEYVRGDAHTQGIESFWALLKRAHKGTFHKISPKHMDRYVHEFAGRHNIRDSGTLAQMRDTVARLVGRNLLYRDLIADNGLASGARS